MAKRWDLFTDSSRLRDALDDLIAAWETASESWNDDVSRRFAEQYLDPMAPVFKSSFDAINRMARLVDQMSQECES